MTPEIRRAQIGRIHAAKSAICLTEQAYRELLCGLTGKQSCSEMADNEINHVLDWLNYLSGRRPARPSFRRAGEIDGASVVRLLYAVSRIVPPGYERSPLTSPDWIARTCGRAAAFEDLDAHERQKLIEGIKAIFSRTGGRPYTPLEDLPLIPDLPQVLEDGHVGMPIPF